MRDLMQPRRNALKQLAALCTLSLGGMPALHAAGRMRLVSVGGALTEIVYALGAGDSLVGVDTTSLYPASAQKLPSVGYARSLSAEGVLALTPTQLIATEEAGPPGVLQQITAAGVPINVLAANHRFEGLIDRVTRVGEITGRGPQATQLAQRLKQEWAQATTQVKTQAAARNAAGKSGTKAPRVLFILAHSPNQIMVGGGDTGADAMIAYAGCINAISGPGAFTGYKPLTPEAVVAAQPDVILLTDQGLTASGGVEGILKLPGLDQTPAGRARRIVSQEAVQLLGFGPRLPTAVATLNGAVTKALSA
ncbi:ABC transporter substrate-binding protein [Uliginosibacterium sp. H3]|uniref:ABC transporter substrate-binding protein n=1 Tax=Uliginosibacterium silvisoli TaxID=3114758 RepID=A0ABU6K2I9_9RHOO|nr:ABC transporter substrate-binding protein [Uliginosibacterium sp. H3]